jgi:hypothetical protein
MRFALSIGFKLFLLNLLYGDDYRQSTLCWKVLFVKWYAQTQIYGKRCSKKLPFTPSSVICNKSDFLLLVVAPTDVDEYDCDYYDNERRAYVLVVSIAQLDTEVQIIQYLLIVPVVDGIHLIKHSKPTSTSAQMPVLVPGTSTVCNP